MLLNGFAFSQNKESDDALEINLAKALFVERFCKFIEWPTNTNQEFLIAYIGIHDDYYTQLIKVFKNSNIKEKKAKVILLPDIESIKNYPVQVIILSDDPFINISEFVKLTKDKPLLTISHREGYCSKGVIINFFLEKEKLRFEINDKNLKSTGLTASYHLLRLAKIINPTSSQKNEN